MTARIATLDVDWTGPYRWPGYSPALPGLPSHPGVYLLTVDYGDGYLIYGVGLTRRPMAARFAEHTRSHLAGDYHVLDLAAVQRGTRTEIWQGWDWSPRKRAAFQKRKSEILRAVRNQLSGFRIFVANITARQRILERVESAIMNTLYSLPAPLCDIPDKGMLLMPRWKSEKPMLTINHFSAHLYGLPKELEI